MKLEFTVVAIKLGDDSIPCGKVETEDRGELSLVCAAEDGDPFGLNSPSGFTHIYCSGEVARSCKIGDRFTLATHSKTKR
jgi:hypothetical protein